MGVELSSWVETVRNHPQLFRFGGLDGFHPSVINAAASDGSYMDKLLEADHAYHLSQLELLLDSKESDYDSDDLEQYHDFLREKTSLADLVDLEAYSCKPIRQQVDMLERTDPCRIEEKRCEFVSVYKVADSFILQESIQEDDGKALLEKYPVVEMKSHASEEGVPVEDIRFVCPSCHSEPHTAESLGEQFYCGLCGCEYFPDTPDEGDLRDDKNLQIFCDKLGIDAFPFREPLTEEQQVVAAINSVLLPCHIYFGDDSGILMPDAWKDRGEQCPDGTVLIVEYQQYSECAKFFSLDACFDYGRTYDTQEQMTKALDDAGFWMEEQTRQASFIYRNPTSSRADPREEKK